MLEFILIILVTALFVVISINVAIGYLKARAKSLEVTDSFLKKPNPVGKFVYYDAKHNNLFLSNCGPDIHELPRRYIFITYIGEL